MENILTPDEESDRDDGNHGGLDDRNQAEKRKLIIKVKIISCQLKVK